MAHAHYSKEGTANMKGINSVQIGLSVYILYGHVSTVLR